MRHSLRQFLATAIIFFSSAALAVPKGEVKDYAVKTSYQCQTNGVIVRNGETVVGRKKSQEIKFTAKPGQNQTLNFGDREYMIWPRITSNTFDKNLNVLVKDESGKFKIAQEIYLGDAQKTKTTVALTIREGTHEEKPVTCAIEIEWVKKTVQVAASK